MTVVPSIILLATMSALELSVILLWCVASVWLVLVVFDPFAVRRHKRLGPSEDASRRPGPLVSILVPARNEERRIVRESVTSMLAQDYSDFEVIVVDDRSTDGTFAVLSELAAEHPRLRPIRGRELPPGWLGKPHAMQQALEQARGEWVLTTDADIIMHPATVRTALRFAQEQGADLLTLWPGGDCRGFWDRLMLPVMTTAFLLAFGQMEADGSRATTVGGFTLLRRGLLDDIGGYRAVRTEVSEDLALGVLLKNRGQKLCLRRAPRLLKVRWYTSFKEVWQGTQKNLFSLIGHDPLVTVGLLLACFVLVIMPPLVGFSSLMVSLAGGSSDGLAIAVPAMIAYLLMSLLHASSLRDEEGISGSYALLAFLGYLILGVILPVTIWKMKTGRGLEWKGRSIHAVRSQT